MALGVAGVRVWYAGINGGYMNFKPKPKHLMGVPPKRKKGERLPHDRGLGIRPTDYRPEYCGALVRYFSDSASWDTHFSDKGTAQILPKNKLPTFERFASSIGVYRRTLMLWREVWPDFNEAYEEALSLQKAFLMELSAAGVGANGCTFILRCNHGMKEPASEEQEKDLPIQKVVVEVVGANQHKGD